ncbi:MAG: S-layer homology domain-containing protein, partial [Niameybacter sp.]
STWSADAIGSLVAGGYIKGYEDKTFRPQGNITRAEIVTMLDNLSPNYISKAGTYTASLKGGTVINAGDVTLKDITIDGNLYITQAVANSKVTLDNVKVTGTLYIDGGTVQLGGDFQTIEVASGKSVDLRKG